MVNPPPFFTGPSLEKHVIRGEGVSSRRVLENPLHQCGNAEPGGSPLLVVPHWPGHVDVHPLDLLVNELQKRERRQACR